MQFLQYFEKSDFKTRSNSLKNGRLLRQEILEFELPSKIEFSKLKLTCHDSDFKSK